MRVVSMGWGVCFQVVLLPSCGRPLLSLPMQVLQQLDQAITLACSPSHEVGQLARSVAHCCSEEQAAAARLRDAVNGRGLPARTLDAAAVLAEAIEGATAFPRLAGGCQGLGVWLSTGAPGLWQAERMNCWKWGAWQVEQELPGGKHGIRKGRQEGKRWAKAAQRCA